MFVLNWSFIRSVNSLTSFWFWSTNYCLKSAFAWSHSYLSFFTRPFISSVFVSLSLFFCSSICLSDSSWRASLRAFFSLSHCSSRDYLSLSDCFWNWSELFLDYFLHSVDRSSPNYSFSRLQFSISSVLSLFFSLTHLSSDDFATFWVISLHYYLYSSDYYLSSSLCWFFNY
jgi:hypothetical protein